eukprot:104508-Chlamydomonas_euryale.AAC.1
MKGQPGLGEGRRAHWRGSGEAVGGERGYHAQQLGLEGGFRRVNLRSGSCRSSCHWRAHAAAAAACDGGRR